MAASPLGVPGAKATLFLSLGMTMLGMTGVVVGYYQLRAHTSPPSTEGVPPELEEQVLALEEEVRASTLPEATATANLLVSGLLVVGSFLLTARRKSALWWARQGLIANVLYTIFATLAQLHQLSAYGPRIALLMASMMEADPAGPPPEEVAAIVPWMVGSMVVVLGLAMLALYAVLFFVARRADVARFVQGE